MPRTFTLEERDEAIALGQEVGPSEAGRRLGICRTTVSSWMRRAGVRSDAADITRAATATAAAKNAARRAALAEGLLEDALKLRSQIFAPTLMHNFGGRDNTYEQHEIPEPTAKDKQALMNSIMNALKGAMELERFDSDESADVSALKAWLAAMRGE